MIERLDRVLEKKKNATCIARDTLSSKNKEYSSFNYLVSPFEFHGGVQLCVWMNALYTLGENVVILVFF